MHDWETLVSSRLGDLRLCAEARRDVVRELASHFEEAYDDARDVGTPDAAARRQALGAVRDWKRFAAAIEKEKEAFMTMTPFRQRVLVPGLASLLCGAVTLQLIHSLGYRGHEGVFQMFRMDYGLYAVFNVPWLISLPLAGAVGAWTSYRGGGNAWHRSLAAVFPSLMYAWIVLMGLVMALGYVLVGKIAGSQSGDASVAVWMARIASFLLPFVLAPAVASLVGALPFLWMRPLAPTHPAEAVQA